MRNLITIMRSVLRAKKEPFLCISHSLHSLKLKGKELEFEWLLLKKKNIFVASSIRHQVIWSSEGFLHQPHLDHLLMFWSCYQAYSIAIAIVWVTEWLSMHSRSFRWRRGPMVGLEQHGVMTSKCLLWDRYFSL